MCLQQTCEWMNLPGGNIPDESDSQDTGQSEHSFNSFTFEHLRARLCERCCPQGGQIRGGKADVSTRHLTKTVIRAPREISTVMPPGREWTAQPGRLGLVRPRRLLELSPERRSGVIAAAHAQAWNGQTLRWFWDGWPVWWSQNLGHGFLFFCLFTYVFILYGLVGPYFILWWICHQILHSESFPILVV